MGVYAAMLVSAAGDTQFTPPAQMSDSEEGDQMGRQAGRWANRKRREAVRDRNLRVWIAPADSDEGPGKFTGPSACAKCKLLIK